MFGEVVGDLPGGVDRVERGDRRRSVFCRRLHPAGGPNRIAVLTSVSVFVTDGDVALAWPPLGETTVWAPCHSCQDSDGNYLLDVSKLRTAFADGARDVDVEAVLAETPLGKESFSS